MQGIENLQKIIFLNKRLKGFILPYIFLFDMLFPLKIYEKFLTKIFKTFTVYGNNLSICIAL